MSKSDEAIKAAPPASRRLLNRKLPEEVFHLRAVEPAEERAARQAVTDAREQLETASWRNDEDATAVIDAAKEELAKARAALATCYEPVVIRALPPEEFEDLAEEHPGRDGKDEPYNPLTLNPALFLACVEETSPYTAQEWTEEIIPQLSKGELTSLQLTAIALNGRSTDGAIPKD